MLDVAVSYKGPKFFLPVYRKFDWHFLDRVTSISASNFEFDVERLEVFEDLELIHVGGNRVSKVGALFNQRMDRVEGFEKLVPKDNPQSEFVYWRKIGSNAEFPEFNGWFVLK